MVSTSCRSVPPIPNSRTRRRTGMGLGGGYMRRMNGQILHGHLCGANLPYSSLHLGVEGEPALGVVPTLVSAIMSAFFIGYMHMRRELINRASAQSGHFYCRQVLRRKVILELRSTAFAQVRPVSVPRRWPKRGWFQGHDKGGSGGRGTRDTQPRDEAHPSHRSRARRQYRRPSSFWPF